MGSAGVTCARCCCITRSCARIWVSISVASSAVPEGTAVAIAAIQSVIGASVARWHGRRSTAYGTAFSSSRLTKYLCLSSIKKYMNIVNEILPSWSNQSANCTQYVNEHTGPCWIDPLLNWSTARAPSISIVFLPHYFAFGALLQTRECRHSFDVWSLMHRLRRSSEVRRSKSGTSW